MVEQHDAKKDVECELCGKTFLKQWRLKKHSLLDAQKAKMCPHFLLLIGILIFLEAIASLVVTF
jgi:hypothetical protein